MSRYEFKQNDVYDFRRHIGATAKEVGYEMRFRECPYCHGGQHHDKETFSINLQTGQFECKRSSCNAHGNMITLAKDFNFNIGIDLYPENNRKQYRKLKIDHITPKSPAVEYFSTRGISKAICDKYELTTQTEHNNIVVFPFRNEKGECKTVKYRKTDFDKSKDKSKEWFESNCEPILFGMYQCNKENKTLIITEGQIDSLSLSEAGIENAVSVPGGCKGYTWVPNVWEWFTSFDELIVFGDHENGKITLVDELSKRFTGKVKVVREEDYKECKDANEILQKHGKQALIDAVQNAEYIPMKRIRRLADVKAVDIYNMERVYTRIEQLDKVLGGLYFGQLILLTGKRGEGKSTFMSQLAIEALDQGYPALIYSGELLDFYFKRWLDLQIAGPRNLTEQKGMYTSYTLTNSTIEKINNWYRDKAFIYDNNIIDDDEQDDLIKTVEKAIKQYGIKLVCIDNLMTAIEPDPKTDLYRAQSKFVGDLAKIAKQYNVLIILVAHPRKTMGGFQNDDVSGSADITNKVDVVMSYSRLDDNENDHRGLKITKNRLTGRLTKDKEDIDLYYSESSKRIVGNNKNFDREYGWNKDMEGFSEALPDELPFE